MYLSEVVIDNFRGIKSLTIQFDKLTVLIGENNTGKSTILEAIKLALSPATASRRSKSLSEYDLHLSCAESAPHTCEAVKILLHFSEFEVDEWSDEIVQRLDNVIQLDVEKDIRHIFLQITGSFNPDTAQIETILEFLNFEKVSLPIKGNELRTLVNFSPLFFLSALRNSYEEFGQRGQFWNSFLKTIQLPEEQRKPLEEQLKMINDSLIESNVGLSEVKKHIEKTGGLVRLGKDEPVTLEALPTRLFDMTGKIQVHLKSEFGAKLPLHRHGEGTQSLAVLLLFHAFADNSLAEIYSSDTVPILALEEPEAHLHPSAVRSLTNILQEMPGQIIVASHSGELVAKIPASSLRRVYKCCGQTRIGRVFTYECASTINLVDNFDLEKQRKVINNADIKSKIGRLLRESFTDRFTNEQLRKISANEELALEISRFIYRDSFSADEQKLFLNSDELRAIDYHIKKTRGSFLFSRCWLLVEGESDGHILPLMGELLDIEQNKECYSVLEFSQSTSKGEHYIKLAKSLGIEWFMVADGDSEGNSYIARASKYLESGELEGSRMKQLGSSSIEQLFWDNGFDDFITKMIPDTALNDAIRNYDTDPEGLVKRKIELAYENTGGKPAFATLIYDEVKRRGITHIPTDISDILQQIKRLSRG